MPTIYSMTKWNEEIIRKGRPTNAIFRCRALFTLDSVDECTFIHYSTMNVDYENKVS